MRLLAPCVLMVAAATSGLATTGPSRSGTADTNQGPASKTGPASKQRSGAKQAPRTTATPATKPTPAPKPMLEGTVKGPDGRPVEGARVRARPIMGRWDEPPITATTGADGRFRLDLRSRDPHDVTVDAKGLAALRTERVSPGTPLSLRLGKGSFIEGEVRDEAGQPVAGARVRASSQRMAWASAWEDSSAPEATTDARGRFRLPGIAAGLQTVEAAARGFGRATRRSVRPGAAVTLTLRPGGWIAGTVSDPEGDPVAGARVRAEREPQFWGAVGNAETADAEGRFSLTGVAAGSYTLVVQHPDFAPALLRGLAVTDDGAAEAALAFARATKVAGRLVDGEGRPVKGRVVVQAESEQALPFSLTELLKGEADDNGRFALPRVGPGTWELGVLGPGFAGRRVTASVSGREPDLDLGEIVLERGLGLLGRVRTAAGAPIAGATLNAYPESMMTGETFAEARSEEDGTFVLGGLGPGAYNLHAQAVGYAPLEKPVSAGAERVDIVLSPGGSLTGLVVDEGRRPLDSFEVFARVSDDRRGSGFSSEIPKSVGSADGRFRLDDLREATYVVQVAAPERTPASVSGVKVAGGRLTDAGVIVLARGGTIRGTVTDQGGAAVPAASVKSLGIGQDMLQWLELFTATTDGAGGFEIKGVPAGSTTVVGSHPDFATGEAAVVVEPTKGPSDVRLTLTRGGRIEGLAHRRDGVPIVGQTVHVMYMGPGGPRIGRGGNPSSVTRADGTFAVEHVAAGSVALTLMAETGPGRTISTLTKQVEVREGETTGVEFVPREILVSGRATRSGSPLSGVNLQLWSTTTGTTMTYQAGGLDAVPRGPSGPERNHAVTREDGSFELVVDEPGRFWVDARTVDGRLSFPGRSLTVPDTDTHFVELSYSGVPVAGIVVDKGTQQPIASARVSAERRPTEDEGSGGTTGGVDGRFAMDLEPANYLLSAAADEYTEARSEVAVGSSGVSDLRFELEPGQALTGRIVDAQGRGVSGLMAFAVDGESARQTHARTLPDGSFRFTGLADKRYSVCAGNPQAGYALRAGLVPGGKDVTIPLRPAGQLRLLVRGPDGAPVEGAQPQITRVGGTRVAVPSAGVSATNAVGIAELSTPPGDLEIEVWKDKQKGTVRVRVAEGESTSSEVVLSAEGTRP